jgi:WD40 repeat protein
MSTIQRYLALLCVSFRGERIRRSCWLGTSSAARGARLCSSLGQCSFEDGRVSALDVETFKPWVVWKAHDASVLAIRAMGPRIVTQGREGVLTVWDLPLFDKGATGTPKAVGKLLVAVGTYCPFVVVGDDLVGCPGAGDSQASASVAATSEARLEPVDVQTLAGDLLECMGPSGRGASWAYEQRGAVRAAVDVDRDAPSSVSLGEDGLPSRAGMLMSMSVLVPPSPLGESGDAPWIVMGFDSGRVVAFRSSSELAECEEANLVSIHPSLHPLTCMAVDSSSTRAACGSSADHIVILSVAWKDITVAEPVPMASVSVAAASTSASVPPSTSGLGALFSRSKKPPPAKREVSTTVPELSVQGFVQLPRGGVSCVEFSHAGRILVATCWDGHVRVFDCWSEFEQVACLSWHRLSVYALSALPGDASLAFATGDKSGRIALWDVGL